MQAAGRKIYHLGFGQSPFPVPQFAQEALREHAWSNEYLPVAGKFIFVGNKKKGVEKIQDSTNFY